MKRCCFGFIVILSLIGLSTPIVSAASSRDFVENTIDEFIISKGRQDRKEILELAIGVVDTLPMLNDTRKLILDVIEEDKRVYTKNATDSLILYGLETNTSITSIDLDDIAYTEYVKDEIPAISFPSFISQEVALNHGYVGNLTEGVVLYDKNTSTNARFYPFSILSNHSIVNDVFLGKPVAITYCPICGTAVTYDRSVDGTIIEFGSTGMLYEGNSLLYDDNSQSLWSQAFGKGIVGIYTDYELSYFPSKHMKFEDFASQFSQGLVMSDKTGYDIEYGSGRTSDNTMSGEYLIVDDPRGFCVVFDKNKLLKKGIGSVTVSNAVTITSYTNDSNEIEVEDGHNILKYSLVGEDDIKNYQECIWRN